MINDTTDFYQRLGDEGEPNGVKYLARSSAFTRSTSIHISPSIRKAIERWMSSFMKLFGWKLAVYAAECKNFHNAFIQRRDVWEWLTSGGFGEWSLRSRDLQLPRARSYLLALFLIYSPSLPHFPSMLPPCFCSGTFLHRPHHSQGSTLMIVK